MGTKAKIENKKFLLILLGTLLWSATMFKSGLVYDFGMGFWGPNAPDGTWHISLITHLARGSLEIPVFAGYSLQNYHIGFDLLLATIHRFTSIPAVSLYFQIVPPIIGFLVGVFTYKFVMLWRRNENEALWATFFVYFAGSWGWVVTLIRDGSISGESMFWAQQAITTLVNPPFALSLVFILAGLILTTKYLKDPKTSFYLATIILFGVLVQIKVYGGLLVLGGLLVGGLYRYIVEKKFDVLKIFLGALAVSLVVFLPTNKASSSLVIFQPFWFLETLMAASDRFYWPKMAEAMLSYKYQNVYSKFVMAYGLAFLIFLFGNVGTRVLGFYYPIKKLGKKLDWRLIFTTLIVVAGILLPLLFLQKATPWNTIQFTYYSLFFLSILAGISTPLLLEKLGSKKKVVAILVVVLTLPTTYGALMNYLPHRPPAAISNQELAALRFLSTLEDGVVLRLPVQLAREIGGPLGPPAPLYLYSSSAYVSAFSEKPVFLEHTGNVDIVGYDPRPRQEEIRNFLNTNDQDEARKFLLTNNITFVYWVKGQRAVLGETQLGLDKIFENEDVDIYRVKK